MNRLCLIALSLLISCSNRKSASETEIRIADSARYRVTTLGEWERRDWEYFQELESEIKRQKENFTDEQVSRYIQEMIDNRLIGNPMLFLETEEGTKLETVDYLTYKKYRLEHPVDSMRSFTVIPKLTKEDSLAY